MRPKQIEDAETKLDKITKTKVNYREIVNTYLDNKDEEIESSNLVFKNLSECKINKRYANV